MHLFNLKKLTSEQKKGSSIFLDPLLFVDMWLFKKLIQEVACLVFSISDDIQMLYSDQI